MPKGIATSVVKTLSLPKARYPPDWRISILATSEEIQTTLTGCTKLAVYLNQALRLELSASDGFGRNTHERSVTEHAA